MKQKFIIMLTVVSILFAFNVSAEPRYDEAAKCNAYLSFSGTTASCSIKAEGAYQASMDAVLTLYDEDGVEVMTWDDLSGTTRLSFTGYVSVVRGETYELIASAVVDGESVSGSVTATCK